ncbi:hypothetical protein B4O97_00540 [Marispirochaeta aestuarii]|uniref:Uncharacterized protein n=1 Tax=Marispirochaeta aestuarii TaxID=1963862 RepID=A0A1Y1S2X7_9SPIO|nr:hypothetical protein B4O97_00540 [Marispirochaeta aestuarii]
MYTPEIGYNLSVKHWSFLIFITILLFLLPVLLVSQDLDWDALRGSEEFRFGVQAYNSGLFDNALLSFERALSYSPLEALYKEWLGRTYHRLGYDATALSLWREVLSSGEGSALLQQRVDVISARNSLERERSAMERFVLGEVLQGRQADYTLFARPLGLEPWPDGSYFLTSFVNNEVYHFNLNGGLLHTLQGGVLGFSRPYDVMRYSSRRIYVSEFGADRIAYCRPDGSQIVRFGRSGGGAGELSGPQFLARDQEGYIYVTEAGNRRVSKFSSEGDFILSFGRRGNGFNGFRTPSGIVVHDGKVFVSDTRQGRVFCFDLSGNFLYEAGADVLIQPEGISVFSARELLIADGERLMIFQPVSRSFELLADFEGDNRRIVDAVRDVNGNLLVSDFNRSELGVLSELSTMYSGIFVEIERIDATGFPDIYLDVSVRDRLGDPIVGLRESNFILSEGHGMPGSPALLAQGDALEGIQAALVLEKSAYTRGREDELAAAVEDILEALPEGSSVRLYTAGELPVKEVPPGGAGSDYIAAAQRTSYDGVSFAFAETMRMAALELAPLRGRKLIISLGSGRAPLRRDESSAPSTPVLANLLSTNGIRFAYVQLERQLSFGNDEGRDIYSFLANESGGGLYPLYRPAGIAPVISEYGERPTGRYYLKLISNMDPDYGKQYLPVEVEVAYYNRTGRDELGYYAPPPYN